MAERLGIVYVELDLDKTKFEKNQQQVIQQANSTALSIEKNYQILGVKSDNIYNAMAQGARNAYERIANSANVSAAEQVRAQSAMVAKINSLNQEMTKNPLYEQMGIRSMAAINAQKNAVMLSYNTLKSAAASNATEIVRLERAKNEKLKELNREMTGAHEMSMASMMRAILRFYAAYYVGSAVFGWFKDQIMGGIKAIDDMKISVIGVAAQITTMQGTTGDIVKNYKDNLQYAKALVPVLMQIDAQSFANLSQIQKMNMAMSLQGTILDVNNQKQLQAFTALTNAVALFTQGQDKERQAAQEIRALFTGQVRAGNQVALMMDGLIRKQGEYRDGLKGLIAEGNKHGDTLERMMPYLSGIIAASGDISATWEAVSASLETAWNIVQRKWFAGVYEDMVKYGRDFVEWIKDADNGFARLIDRITITGRAIKDLWNILPEGTGTAATYGIIGGLLFGSTPVGALIASLSIIIDKLKTIEWIQEQMARKAKEEAGFADVAARVMARRSGLFGGGTSRGGVTRDFGIETPSLPKGGPTEEELAAVKKAADKAADIQKQVTEIIRKNQLERESIGKLAYEKELLQIESMKAKYKEQGFSEKQILLITTEEKKTALAKLNEEIRVSNEKAFIEEYNTEKKTQIEIGKIKLALILKNEEKIENANKKSAKERADAAKDFNKITAATAEFDVSENQRAINLIIAQEAEKLNALYVAYSLQGDYSEAMYQRMLKAEQDIIRNSEAAKEAHRMKELQREADFYDKILGFSKKSYEADLVLIEARRIANTELYDKEAADNMAVQEIVENRNKQWEKENKNILSVMASTSDMFGSAAEMFDKESSQYKTLMQMKQVMHTAELAMNVAKQWSNYQTLISEIAKAKAAGATAVAAQGQIPIVGFAMAAAMVAFLASTFSSLGVSFSGGGGSSASAPSAAYGIGTTTLGGANNEGSQSITKSWELLEDTYDMQYTKLTGIYNEMKDLNLNITGLVRGIIRTGGFSFTPAMGTGMNADPFGFGGGEGWKTGFPLLDKGMNWLQSGIFGGGIESYSGGSGIGAGSQSVGGLRGGAAMPSYGYTTTGYHESGGWFSSDKDWVVTTYQALNEDVSGLITKVFANMGDTLVSLSEGLGADTQAALNYVFTGFQLSLEGMSAEAISKTLTETFSGIMDTAVSVLIGNLVRPYQKVGEGMMETASRILMDKAIVMENLRLTNQAFRGTIPKLIQFSEALITVAGGLDKLTESMKTYYDKFFSDVEKQADLQSSLTRMLAQYGMSLPDQRSSYRSLVESLNMTTEAGQAAYVALMQMSEGADKYYSYLEEVKSKVAANINPESYSTNLEYRRALAGYAEGGIASGPTSGYTATLHGTELVVSPRTNYPASVKGGNAELVMEVKALREDLKAGNFQIAANTQKSAKFLQYLEQWDDDGIPATRN